MGKVLLGVALAVIAASAKEDYGAWERHKILTLIPMPGLVAPVDSFPLLVRLTAADFGGEFARAGAAGASIRFTDSTGTLRYPHQRERWDAAGQKAEFWVKVPRVHAGARATRLRLYWSNGAAADSSNAAQVFTIGNGFVARWQLGDSGTVRSSSVAGAPIARIKNFGGGYAAPEGLIGRADTLTGGAGQQPTSITRPWIDLNPARANYAGFNAFLPGITYSIWVYETSAGLGARYLHLQNDSVAANNLDNRIAFFRPNPDNGRVTVRMGTQNNRQEASAAHPLVLGQWQHLAFTKASGMVGMRIYYNGRFDTLTNVLLSFIESGPRLWGSLGYSPSNLDQYFSGKLDEAQLSNVERDSNWIRLSFETQCLTGVSGCPAFSPLSLGATTGLRAEDPGAGAARAADGFSVEPAGRGLAFRLQGARGGRAMVSLIDPSGGMVWSGAFAPGATRLGWDGRAADGTRVSAGVYAVRLTVFDKQGKALQVVDRTVPYAR